MQQDDDDDMPALVYHSRMQYLKREEGKRLNNNNNKQRRRSSYNIFDDSNPTFQEQLQPCSRDILLPPNELMTRTQSFRHAYWEHHFQPTTRIIKQVFPETNEGTERRIKKRKEILAKITANEKAKREAELRRRAEKLLSQQNNNSIVESESDDESDDEGSSIASCVMRSTIIGTTRRRVDGTFDNARSRQTICAPPSKHHGEGTVLTSETRTQPKTDNFTTGFAFSFLSEWANEDKNG